MQSAGVIVILPHPTYGGAERLTAAIVVYLRSLDVPVSLAIATHHVNLTDSTAEWFSPICEVHRLHDAPDPAVAWLELLDRTGSDCVTLVGRSPAYDWARNVVRIRPDIRLTSFQFNAIECVQENRRLAPLLDVVIAESRVAAAALDRTGLLGVPLRVISSGVDARRLAKRARVARPGSAPLVAFIGRFDESKNPGGFVRMAAAMGQARARLLMIGDGPSQKQVRRLAQDLGVSAQIEWAGLLPDADLERRFDEVDILIVPSLNDGRPLVVQEAQARGIAVIASRCGAIPDLIDHGRTGLLCEPGDDLGFARSAVDLLADMPKRESLGRAAQAHVLQSHDLTDALPRYAAAITGIAPPSIVASGN
jgi:glycosyltransferase involved in cell wall biosynthesis